MLRVGARGEGGRVKHQVWMPLQLSICHELHQTETNLFISSGRIHHMPCRPALGVVGALRNRSPAFSLQMAECQRLSATGKAIPSPPLGLYVFLDRRDELGQLCQSWCILTKCIFSIISILPFSHMNPECGLFLWQLEIIRSIEVVPWGGVGVGGWNSPPLKCKKCKVHNP